MHHFFVTPDQVQENQIYIVGSDVNHMKNVLRMKVGEKFQVSDGNDKKYVCRIEQMNEEEVEKDGRCFQVGHTKEYMKVAVESCEKLQNKLIDVELVNHLQIIH